MKRLYILPAFVACTAMTRAQSTIDPAERWSFGANTGWINWRPNEPTPDGGAVTGEAVLSGRIYSANAGWIDLGDGSPANGVAYQNTSATDFGVNVVGGGELAGFAYAANLGWIQFEQDEGEPRIDLLTGEFSGFAWCANAGWINLQTGLLRTSELRCTDTDGDGIGDEWEVEHFDGLDTADGTTDADADGATDKDEYGALTDPNDPQSRQQIISITRLSPPGESLEVVFTSRPGRVYSAKTSTTLEIGSWANVSGLELFLPDPGLETTIHLTPATDENRRFFRILAQKPLQP